MEADNRFDPEGEGSRMGVPYVTSFLWCFNLKIGSKLISLGHFAVATTAMVICAIMASESHQYIGSGEDADCVYSKTFYAATAIAVMSVAHMLLALSLLYGVLARKASFLRAYVHVMLALYAAAIVFLAVTPTVYGFNATGSDIFLGFFEGLLLFALIGYCILCVYSYYLMLKSTEDMDHPNKTDY